MQTLTHQAQQTIDFQQARLSPYMPSLGAAIGKTYLVPFGGLMVANLIINLLIFQIPGLFTGIIGSAASLAVFLGVLYYGWRWAENRWQGTSLFVQYTALSKSRRLLRAELVAENPSDAVVQQYMSDFVGLVDGFVDRMHELGLIPEKPKTE